MVVSVLLAQARHCPFAPWRIVIQIISARLSMIGRVVLATVLALTVARPASTTTPAAGPSTTSGAAAIGVEPLHDNRDGAIRPIEQTAAGASAEH
jgi:hypothetical protein